MLDELLYADGMNNNVSSEANMQGTINQVSQSCDRYNLTINTKDRGCTPTSTREAVDGQILKVVDKLTYLGNTLSRAENIDD